MAMKFSLDDGYTEITVETPDGQASARLDLFEAHNQYATLCDAHPDPVERANEWVTWLASKGLPPVSHGVAFRIAAAVMGDVAEFKKKAGDIWGSADSQGSSGSPSSE